MLTICSSRWSLGIKRLFFLVMLNKLLLQIVINNFNIVASFVIYCLFCYFILLVKLLVRILYLFSFSCAVVFFIYSVWLSSICSILLVKHIFLWFTECLFHLTKNIAFIKKKASSLLSKLTIFEVLKMRHYYMKSSGSV